LGRWLGPGWGLAAWAELGWVGRGVAARVGKLSCLYVVLDLEQKRD